MLNILVLATNLASAQPVDACGSDGANTAFQAGYEAQQGLDTDTALEEYGRCLELAPDCVTCLYEIGWSHWSRSEWSNVIENWERVLEIEPGQAEVNNWLPQARENLSGRRSTARSTSSSSDLHVPMGLEASGNGLRMELVARFQNYDANPNQPGDHYDTFVYSPKSARFLADGSRVYVNSLEGFRTVIYDPIALERVGSIHHEFTEEDEALFHNETTVFGYRYNRSSPSGNPNHFQGKPVESALSHDDRYLWVPYYRRDYDSGATSPSGSMSGYTLSLTACLSGVGTLWMRSFRPMVCPIGCTAVCLWGSTVRAWDR